MEYKYTIIQHIHLTCLLYEIYINSWIDSVGVEGDYNKIITYVNERDCPLTNTLDITYLYPL